MFSKRPILFAFKHGIRIGLFLSPLLVGTRSPIAQTPRPLADESVSAPALKGRSANDRLAEAEALQSSGKIDSVRRAISIYYDVIREFHSLGAYESEALSWHRISLAARQINDLDLARDTASKARVVLFARLSGSSSLTNVAAAQAARVYLALGRIQLESSEIRDAFQSYEKALSLAEKAELPREIGVTKVALGLLASRADELETAIAITSSSIEAWRAAKDFSGEAMALNNLARFYERKGELLAAAELDGRAAEIYRFNRDNGGENNSLKEIMRVNLTLSNFAEAAEACERLVLLSKARGDLKNEVSNLLSLAAIEVRRGNFASGYRVLLKALVSAPSSDRVIGEQIRDLSRRFDEIANHGNSEVIKGLHISLADQEAQDGRYSAAYQVLLRALISGASETPDQRQSTDSSIRDALRRIEIEKLTRDRKSGSVLTDKPSR